MQKTPPSQRRPGAFGECLRRAILAASLLAAPAALAEDEAPLPGPEAAPAAAQELHPPGFRGWSPSLSVGTGVHVEEFAGSARSSFGTSGYKRETLSGLLLLFGGGLSSPRLESLPGRPRAVTWAEGGFPMRSETTLLSRSVLLGSSTQSQGEQRTELTVKWKWMVRVGAGLEFQLPVGYDIRLTPGIEYLGSKISYRAELSTQNAPDPIHDPFPVRYVVSGVSDPIQRHFLGPRLAGEFAFARVGTLVVSLFLDGRFYWNLGDREERFAFTGSVAGAPQTASARFESGRTAGQLSFGLRGSL